MDSDSRQPIEAGRTRRRGHEKADERETICIAMPESGKRPSLQTNDTFPVRQHTIPISKVPRKEINVEAKGGKQ